MDTRGFTTLEVIVAMAIVGISASIIGASISKSTAVAGAQFEVEKVRDTILHARNVARFQLKCVTVDVQPDHIDTTAWKVCQPFLANPDPTETTSFAPTVTLAAFDSGNPLTFNTLGGTLAPNPSTMVVTTSTGKITRYVVMPAIGTLSTR